MVSAELGRLILSSVCNMCRLKHRTCDGKRPCTRCVKEGNGAICSTPPPPTPKPKATPTLVRQSSSLTSPGGGVPLLQQPAVINDRLRARSSSMRSSSAIPGTGVLNLQPQHSTGVSLPQAPPTSFTAAAAAFFSNYRAPPPQQGQQLQQAHATRPSSKTGEVIVNVSTGRTGSLLPFVYLPPSHPPSLSAVPRQTPTAAASTPQAATPSSSVPSSATPSAAAVASAASPAAADKGRLFMREMPTPSAVQMTAECPSCGKLVSTLGRNICDGSPIGLSLSLADDGVFRLAFYATYAPVRSGVFRRNHERTGGSLPTFVLLSSYFSSSKCCTYFSAGDSSCCFCTRKPSGNCFEDYFPTCGCCQ